MRERDENDYRNYIADQFLNYCKNQYLPIRLADLHKPVERKTAEEIVIDITNRAGLELVDGPS